MKKFLSLIMVAAMLVAVFAMVGCKGDVEETTEATTTEATTTEATTEAPVETTTEAPVEDGGFNWIVLVIVIAVLAIAGGVAGFLVYKKKKSV